MGIVCFVAFLHVGAGLRQLAGYWHKYKSLRYDFSNNIGAHNFIKTVSVHYDFYSHTLTENKQTILIFHTLFWVL